MEVLQLLSSMCQVAPLRLSCPCKLSGFWLAMTVPIIGFLLAMTAGIDWRAKFGPPNWTFQSYATNVAVGGSLVTARSCPISQLSLKMPIFGHFRPTYVDSMTAAVSNTANTCLRRQMRKT